MFASLSFVKGKEWGDTFLYPAKLSSLPVPVIWKMVLRASLEDLRRERIDWHPVARTHHPVCTSSMLPHCGLQPFSVDRLHATDLPT